MNRKTIVIVLLVCVTLYAPLSVFSQSKDFVMSGTELAEYKGNATNVTIPAGVTKIGDNAFSRCTSLTNITIPASVTSIGFRAFSSCTNLKSVTIQAGVTGIGMLAFEGCSNLASITIPPSVTYIGAAALDGTAWFKSQSNGLVYAGKVLYCYKGAMPANTVLNNIRADTVSIASAAFSEIDNLTGITIPASVTKIGEWAFYWCSNLKSINIPASVTSIGDSAFFDCPLPTSVRNDLIKRFGEYLFYEDDEYDYWFGY